MPASDPRAHAAVARALKSGVLVRPDRCEDCETPCKPDAHHDDYDRPLEVRWLCRRCHRRQPMGTGGSGLITIVLRLDPEAIAAIEKVRGDLSREAWIRGAMHQALDGGGAAPVRRISRSVRSSSEVRRDVTPIPKEGKKK